ncbi:MAG: PDZ domain-containing protein, partial [Thermoguttaceae bacterium]
MERRLVLFLVLAFVFFTGYSLLMQRLHPPRKKPGNVQLAQQDKNAPAKKPGEKEKNKKADQAPDKKAASTEKKPKPKKIKAAIQPKANPQPEEKISPEQWVLLGSADHKDPYRMLVTLSNRGAALVRIELNSPRYREIDHRSGYLGDLLIDKTIQGAGLPVQTVAPGTPAAKAGIKIGDLIKGINGKPVTSYKSLQFILSKTRPRQTIQLAILRNGNELVLPVKLTRHPLSVVAPEENDPLSFLLTMQQIGNERIADDEKDQPPDDEKDQPLELGGGYLRARLQRS